MTFKQLEADFANYCKFMHFTIDSSHRDGKRYVCAAPGTVCLSTSDIRIGKKAGIMLNKGDGCIELLLGYYNYESLSAYMMGAMEVDMVKLRVDHRRESVK